MASLSSKLEDYFEEKKQESPSSFIPQSSKPAKIQKVQHYLKEHSEYYFPKEVSIGPIHHHLNKCRVINLEQGEKYKKKWALAHKKEMGDLRNSQQLLESIRSQIEELKECYSEDAIGGFDDDTLAWILFVDGYAVLGFMNEVESQKELKPLDVVVQHDLLLLENQLPYKVLKILNKEKNDTKLRKYIKTFLELHHIPIPDRKKRDDQSEPTHLLDLLRTTILGDDQDEEAEQQPNYVRNYFAKYRNARQLITSGIRIRKISNAWGKSLTSIGFHGQRMYLPKLTVDDFTAQILLNMIAYERCEDFSNKYEVNNYVYFMNSLIDHEDDVKVLRKAGVLKNLLKSDKEVTDIFNDILSTDLLHHTGMYNWVRYRIEKYYQSEGRVWFAEWRYTHFNSPWHFIGIFSTALGIILTLVQLMQAFHIV